jgi:hypothetical protein
MATDTDKLGDDSGISGRELSFYEVDASTIDEAARKLIVGYAGVAPENVERHVDAVVGFPLTLGRAAR